MRFDDLDRIMRTYEESLDQYIEPEKFIIARLDGRSFTKLTKETCDFKKPFDADFRDLMVGTVMHLMKDCGFSIVRGFTESDEISLLLASDSNQFNRKVRKLNSILAGEASAYFSLQLGIPACFDCRIIPLPDQERVDDYFSWRQEDANRNALNSWCYWTLREKGYNAADAQSLIKGKSIEDKKKLLLQYGIDYDTLPVWQRKGVNVTWQEVEKEGWNPQTQIPTVTTRRELRHDLKLSEDFPKGTYKFDEE
jgi:tRNA(His) 5'-end guanylyltransferase